MSAHRVTAVSDAVRRGIVSGVLLALPLVLSMQACGGDDGNGPPEPGWILVTPHTVGLTWIGETVQLAGEVIGKSGNPIAGASIASWTSSATGVCNVDGQGLVTAVGAGTCTVTARSDTDPVVTGEATVNVEPEPAALKWVVQPTAGTADEMLPMSRVCCQDAGGSTVTGDDATSVTVAIADNPGGGSLNGTTARTVSAGCAQFDDLSIDIEGDGYTLVASANGFSRKSAPFPVGANPTSVVVSCPAATIESLGATAQCTAEVRADGRVITGVALTWKSSPTSVCTVDDTGLVTSQGDGSCTVTATETVNDNFDSDVVTIQQTPTQLAFETQPSGGKAEGVLPTVTVCTHDALGSTVTSDNSTQLAVTIGTNPGGGTLSGTAARTATSGCADFTGLSIDVEGDGYTLVADDGNGLAAATSDAFKVARNVATVGVACPVSPLESIGATAQCEAEARSPAGRVIPDPDLAGDPLDTTWGPADPAAVCSVDNAGVVTALDNGSCTIPAEIDAVRGSDIVTVEQKAASLSIVSPELLILAIGEQTTLSVEAFDALDNPIDVPSIAVQCVPGGVVNAQGLDLTGSAAGVSDCVLTSGGAADTVRSAVVEQSGFAGVFTNDTELYRITASPDQNIQIELWMVRPSGGDGDLGSIQGSLSWDENTLTYVGSDIVASGWTWVPNETNAGTGELGFAAFTATGTANTFALARVTFTASGASGSASPLTLGISAAGDPLGADITSLLHSLSSRLNVE